jgi:hypothetical protein
MASVMKVLSAWLAADAKAGASDAATKTANASVFMGSP